MIRFSLNYFRPYKWKFFLVVACSILTAVSELSTPFFTAKFIDEILVANSIEEFYSFMGLIALVTILAIVANYVYIIESTKIQSVIIRDLMQDIIIHTQHVNTEKLIKIDMVYLSKRVQQDAADLIAFILGSIIDISIQFFLLIIATYLIFSIGFQWFVMLAVISVFYFMIYRKLKKYLLKYATLFRETENRYFSALVDNFVFAYAIKLHSLYYEFIKLFHEKYDQFYSIGVKKAKLSFWFSYTRFNSGKLFVLLIFLVGGQKVLYGEMSIGSFVALNGYYMFAMDGIYYFMNFGQGYQNAWAAYSRIMEIMNEPRIAEGELTINTIKQIDIECVSYKAENVSILSDISCSLHTGKIYCITGRNGAGKTTFINLVTGMISPSCGEIRYNGINISKLNMNIMRREHISVMEQKDFIPYDTIDKNISISTKRTDIVKQNDLVTKFGLLELMNSDSNHNIAENRLSGGEKRKISVIRALIKNAEVLIMDEPDNNLDSNSLQILEECLQWRKQNRITLLISHEPKLIDLSDEIIRL